MKSRIASSSDAFQMHLWGEDAALKEEHYNTAATKSLGQKYTHVLYTEAHLAMQAQDSLCSHHFHKDNQCVPTLLLRMQKSSHPMTNLITFISVL